MKNKIAQNKDFPKMDIRRFQAEIETWKQALNSRMEENLLMKSRLSEILRNNYDQNSLEKIEDFQTQFIKEDELNHSLRSDVNNLDNFWYNHMFENEKMEKSFEMKMKKLNKDITNSIIRFHILKSAFNDFQYKISSKGEN